MNNVKKLVKESKTITKELEGMLPKSPKSPKKKRSIRRGIKKVLDIVVFPAFVVTIIGLTAWVVITLNHEHNPDIAETSKLENGWYEVTAEDGRAWVSKNGKEWADKEDFDLVGRRLRSNLREAFATWELQMTFNAEQKKPKKEFDTGE